MKYNYNIGGIIQALSPALNLVPGFGPIAAPLANIAGGMIQQNESPTNYQPVRQNANPYGRKSGGSLNFKSSGAYKKWLAYGHATGKFAATPGHQKVSIKGKRKKVKHEDGGYYEDGGKLSKSYIKKAHNKPGGSNVGKYPSNITFAGPSGGAPKGSYPINTLKRGKAALSYAHNAPNPAGIKAAVYRKYPQLKKEMGGFINDTPYPTGMDQPLSHGGFMVNYQGNVTDAKRYGPYHFDDNEVVQTDKNRIFSNERSLGMHVGDYRVKSPAQLAKPLERAKGRAQEYLQSNPYSREAKNTIDLSNMILDRIFNEQEHRKQMEMGSRNYFQHGGPYHTAPNDFMSFSSPNPGYTSEGIDNALPYPFNRVNLPIPPETQGGIGERDIQPFGYGSAPEFVPRGTGELPYPFNGQQPTIPQNNLAPTPAQDSTPAQATTPTSTSTPAPGSAVPGRAMRGYTLPQGLSPDMISHFQEYSGIKVDGIYGPQTQAAWNAKGQSYLNELANPNFDIGPNSSNSSVVSQLPNIQHLNLANPKKSNLSPSGIELLPNRMDTSLPNAVRGNAPVSRDQGNPGFTPFSVGDYIQMGALGLQGLTMLGGPEHERMNKMAYRQIDSTPIRQQLNRGLRSQLATNRGSSYNLNRAQRQASFSTYLDSLRKLETDVASRNKQVASSTDQFNIGQANLTADLNARNRAAYRNSLQAGIGSLSNFGQGLSKRSTNERAASMVSAAYPDVASFLFEELKKNKKIG